MIVSRSSSEYFAKAILVRIDFADVCLKANKGNKQFLLQTTIKRKPIKSVLQKETNSFLESY